MVGLLRKPWQHPFGWIVMCLCRPGRRAQQPQAARARNLHAKAESCLARAGFGDHRILVTPIPSVKRRDYEMTAIWLKYLTGEVVK